jgi:hypothetical protein
MCHSCCAALLQYCIQYYLAWYAAAVLAALQIQHCCNALAVLFGTWGKALVQVENVSAIEMFQNSS